MIGVVFFATVAEVTGSLVWGVYRYRLHNLPLFIPPAHGLVYLSGLALASVVARAPARCRRRRRLRSAGGLRAITVLPRLDVAGALCVPLLVRLPLAIALPRCVRGRVRRRRGARAVRDVDRHLALGDVAARPRHRRTATRRAASRAATCGST